MRYPDLHLDNMSMGWGDIQGYLGVSIGKIILRGQL